MKRYVIIPAIAFLLASCLGKKKTTVDISQSALDAKPYPLKVCIVSGEELGSMGAAVSIVHEGQTIMFCCRECVPRFKDNPEEYLSQLEVNPAE